MDTQRNHSIDHNLPIAGHVASESVLEGQNGMSKILYSDNFDLMSHSTAEYYRTDGAVYSYLVRNTDGGLVGVHFVLWDLHPASTLRVRTMMTAIKVKVQGAISLKF